MYADGDTDFSTHTGEDRVKKEKRTATCGTGTRHTRNYITGVIDATNQLGVSVKHQSIRRSVACQIGLAFFGEVESGLLSIKCLPSEAKPLRAINGGNHLR